MPIFAQKLNINFVCNLKAFLHLRAGVIQGSAPRTVEELERELAEAHGRLGKLEKEREMLSTIKAGQKEQGAAVVGRETPEAITPESMIWMFGYARTGSTWLAAMMHDMSRQAQWHEPFVGQLFGLFYENWVNEQKAKSKHFILGPPDGAWPISVRNFIIERANATFEKLQDNQWLVVKEPNGSVGAPIIMKALPESKLIFLIRDPRDVTASRLDAFKEGSWLYESVVNQGSGRSGMFEMEQDSLLKNTCEEYKLYIGRSKQAYDAHKGSKALVRYEDLVENTLDTMLGMYNHLKVKVDESELERIVEKHSWSNIPSDKKGDRKFYRKGKAGSWREDLSPDQARQVEELTEPLMTEFYR